MLFSSPESHIVNLLVLREIAHRRISRDLHSQHQSTTGAARPYRSQRSINAHALIARTHTHTTRHRAQMSVTPGDRTSLARRGLWRLPQKCVMCGCAVAVSRPHLVHAFSDLESGRIFLCLCTHASRASASACCVLRSCMGLLATTTTTATREPAIITRQESYLRLTLAKRSRRRLRSDRYERCVLAVMLPYARAQQRSAKTGSVGLVGFVVCARTFNRTTSLLPHGAAAAAAARWPYVLGLCVLVFSLSLTS